MPNYRSYLTFQDPAHPDRQYMIFFLTTNMNVTLQSGRQVNRDVTEAFLIYRDPAEEKSSSYFETAFGTKIATASVSRSRTAFTIKHPKDCPNWLLARQEAFEKLLDSCNHLSVNFKEEIRAKYNSTFRKPKGPKVKTPYTGPYAKKA
jgi:hypothetical protein